jgi:hypothetical protein
MPGDQAELASKVLENKRATVKIRMSMMQVEAVLKMLRPDFNVALIAPKRRVVGNPWFKRGTLFRSAVDVMRRAGRPMTARADHGARAAKAVISQHPRRGQPLAIDEGDVQVAPSHRELLRQAQGSSNASLCAPTRPTKASPPWSISSLL